MSSLTDIIFLLLIFFMLTSSLVQINLDLPESDSKTVASTSATVMIDKDLKVSFNGKKTSIGKLKGLIRTEMAKVENKKNSCVTIAAEKDVPWENISKILAIASGLDAKVIVATQPKK